MSRFALADLLLRDAAALVIVKATVVLALASGAAAAAKGLSAARRHMLWLCALSSCIWLVLSSPVTPTIVIHASALAENAVTTATRPTVGAAPNSGSVTMANASRVGRRSPSADGIWRPSVRSIPLPSHPLIALWIIGCVTLLLRHAIGFVGTTRLAGRASIADDDESTRELAGVAAAVGVRREIRLGYSAEVQTPITFDVAKPYVLLPSEARSWSIERRRAVLVHETAHIARGDWLSQAIGRLACELFWFHPLVWRAFARLRDEAEHAADDCVLRSGMRAFDYATHLLDLAQRTPKGRPELVAIGIVSTHDLERRFVAMFDTKCSRATVTSRVRAVTMSVALAIVCPLAALRVGAPAQLTNAPRTHALLQLAPLAHGSTPQPGSAARATAGERDTARVPRTAEVRAAIVGQSAPKRPQSSITVGEHVAPSPVMHPDFSGRWTSDTVAVPPRLTDFFVTDSLIIRQSEDSIALEERGHSLDAPTHGRFHNITFDGAESSGVAFAGRQNHAQNVVVSSVWMGDTLVLDSHAPGDDDHHTIERMTLSADGNRLWTTDVSFVGGKARYGDPLTFVLRRMMP